MMKRLLSLVLVPALLLGCQSGPDLSGLPSGREIVDRFAEVSGLPLERSEQLAYRSRGRVNVPAMGIQGVFEQSASPPDHYDLRLDLGELGTTRTGFRDGVGWGESVGTGVAWLEGEQLLQMRLQARYDSAAKPEDLYESVRLLGIAEFLDEDCYEVEAVARPLEGMEAKATQASRTNIEYYSLETGLLRGSRTWASTPMGEVEVGTEVSDYRRFGDQWVACRTVQHTPGGEVELLIDDLVFGVVGPGAFEMPSR